MPKRGGKKIRPQSDSDDDEVACPHVSKIKLSNLQNVLPHSDLGSCKTCENPGRRPDDKTRGRRRHHQDDSDSDDDDDDELGFCVCLKCGYIGCDESSKRGHAMYHAKSKRHPVIIHATTLQCWCYECEEYIQPGTSKTVDACAKAIRNALISEDIGEVDPRATHFSSSHHSSKIDIRVPILAKGLENLGNTCFFNSVMQNLSRTAPLMEHFLRLDANEGVEELRIVPSGKSSEGFNFSLLELNVSNPLRSVTTAMKHFMIDMHERLKINSVYNPKALFHEVSRKAPRFRGYQQQDSQEFLRTLFDLLDVEAGRRNKEALMDYYGLCAEGDIESRPLSELLQDLDASQQEEAAAHFKSASTYIYRIFGGALGSTIVCQTCHTVTRNIETFLDLSLPIETHSKTSHVLPKRKKHARVTASAPVSPVLSRKQKEKKEKQQKKAARKALKLAAKIEAKKKKKREEYDVKQQDTAAASMSEGDTISVYSNTSGSIGTGSSSHRRQESVGSSQSLFEYSTQPDMPLPVIASPDTINSDELKISGTNLGLDQDDVTKDLKESSSGVAALEMDVSNLTIRPDDIPSVMIHAPDSKDSDGELDETITVDDDALSTVSQEINAPILAGTAVPPYIPKPGERSLASCLAAFCAEEHLDGDNMFSCENCYKVANPHKRIDPKDSKGVKRVAVKRFLINSAPRILTIHLKRFEQHGYYLQKVNKSVSFPLVLDIAPFCSANCPVSVYDDGVGIRYGLYGIVEHSGRLNTGHYVAYVKEVLSPEEESKNRRSRWFLISDSYVKVVSEAEVLKCQPYLLFYERYH